MVPLVTVMSPTAKLEVASLAVNVSERVPSEDVSPSLTSAAVIVIVGAALKKLLVGVAGAAKLEIIAVAN